MKRVLFLCTHNAARSQMAEGLLRQLGHEQFAAFSAGTQATQVRPEAIAVMAELGIDISKQEPKTLDRFLPPEGTPSSVLEGQGVLWHQFIPRFPVENELVATHPVFRVWRPIRSVTKTILFVTKGQEGGSQSRGNVRQQLVAARLLQGRGR
jgi:hypothetical protein